MQDRRAGPLSVLSRGTNPRATFATPTRHGWHTLRTIRNAQLTSRPARPKRGTSPRATFPAPPLWTPASAGVTKWDGRNDEVGEAVRLHRHHRIHVAGGEGIHVGED